MVECKSSFECWTWNCSCHAHNYSWTRKKKQKNKAFNPQVSTKNWWFCPHLSKTGNKFVKVWSGNKNGGRFFDGHIEIRKAGSPPQRFFFRGKILDAKSFFSLQRRTNKNKIVAEIGFLQQKNWVTAHCFWWEWSTHWKTYRNQQYPLTVLWILVQQCNATFCWVSFVANSTS